VPSYREYLNVDSYNDNLEPEHLSTFEAQAGKLFQIGDKKGDVNITYFYNVYSNFIQELIVDSIVHNDGTVREVDDEMAFNLNKRSTSGMELNLSLYPAKGLFVNMGGSYLFKAEEETGSFPEGIYPAYTDNGTVDLTFLSDFTANVLVSYNFLKHFRVGTKMLYCSTRSVPDNYQEDILDDYPEVYNPSNADGFVRLDLFARAKIANKLDFDFKVNNILNSRIYSPPYSSPTKYDIEWPGTTFSIGVRYRFN
jgi:outer membrane receptor for ferrienterochelin and colicin